MIAALMAGLPSLASADERNTDRVVAIGGSLTEIVYALGKGHTVVGVDQTSSWPPAVKDLPQVGYYKNVSAEGVLSLAPTLVLTYRDAEPAAALRQLREAGVQVVTFERIPLLEALAENITTLGAVFSVPADAARLNRAIRESLDATARAVSGVSPKPRALFLLNYDPSQMIAAGRGTIPDQLIALAGGINAAADITGYKPLNAEMLAFAAPDVVLTVEERWDSMGGAEMLKRLPGMADTPAARDGRFVTLPGPLVLGPGPRIGEAVERLARLLHGERMMGERMTGDAR